MITDKLICPYCYDIYNPKMCEFEIENNVVTCKICGKKYEFEFKCFPVYSIQEIENKNIENKNENEKNKYYYQKLFDNNENK